MTSAGAKVKVVNVHRYIGGFMGEGELEKEWIMEKVEE